MDTVYVSALAALAGSAIGALASIGTSWLTQRYQNQSQRAAEKRARLEQIFGEFIDQASRVRRTRRGGACRGCVGKTGGSLPEI
jgi:hypothetical protein